MAPIDLADVLISGALLLILIGGLNGVRRQLGVLVEAMYQVRESVSILSGKADDLAREVTKFPENFVRAYDRSRRIS